jgi:hypothetical protein
VVDKENLKKIFLNDLKSISETLINAFDLKFEEEIENLSAPLMRWLDFSLRFVEPKPRKVVLSKKFPNCIPAEIDHAFNLFCNLVEQGGDLNPFQGKGLIKFNDTSAEKKQKRTDLLWANWGILHFHLSCNKRLAGSYFSPRSEWLTFAILANNSIGVIDIRHHNDENLFSDVNLIHTIAESWPTYLDKFELVGIIASKQPFESDEHSKLWKAGIVTPVCFGNKTYIGPGLGITTAAIPSKVILTYDRIKSFVILLAEMVDSEEKQFKQVVKKMGISDPEFHLCITPNGLAVLEEKSNFAFLLPGLDKNPNSNFLVELTNLLLPAWALGRINSITPI